MTENFEKTSGKEPFLGNMRQRHFGVGTLTVLFLSVCSLMTFGFCKFSFYLLKNHRSLVERSEIPQSYADIRPFFGDKNAAETLTAEAPVFFYDSQKPLEFNIADTFSVETETSFSAAETQNISVEEKIAVVPVDATANNGLIAAHRLAPFADKPIKTAAVLKNSAAEEFSEKEETPVKKDPPVLDDLIVSGTDLLNETDERLTQTVVLLDEKNDDAPEILQTEHQEDFVQKTDISVLSALSVSAKELPPAKPPVVEKAIEKASPAVSPAEEEGTHWVDLAELRRRINEKKSSGTAVAAAFENNLPTKKASKPAETVQYKSAKEMPETKQTASLTPLPVSDVPAVVEDIPVQGTEDVTVASVQKADELPVIKNEKSEKQAKTQNPAQKNTAKAPKKRKNLWKISKVNGQTPKNHSPSADEDEFDDASGVNAFPAVQSENTRDNNNYNDDAVLSAQITKEQADEPSAVIYRNGKVKRIIASDGTQTEMQPQLSYREKQTEEWLEGQEAAVWTNMSQSDVPSVWSFASQEENNSDKPKAFKVAAPTAPAAAAPEGQTSSEASPAAPAPVAAPAATQATAPAVGNAAPSQPAPAVLPALPNVIKPLSVQKPNAAEKQEPLFGKMSPDEKPAETAAKIDDSLAGKLLSLFSKDGAPASKTPMLGANAPQSAGAAENASAVNGAAKPKTTLSQKDIAALLKKKTSSRDESANTILPDEIRLTFKQGNADLSAQSVSLVKRFAEHAKKDVQAMIEVRISDKDTEIQEKRFAIIRNILLGAGAEDSQILLYQSPRSPNTLILRTFIISDEEYESQTSWLNGVEERLYYKKW